MKSGKKLLALFVSVLTDLSIKLYHILVGKVVVPVPPHAI